MFEKRDEGNNLLFQNPSHSQPNHLNLIILTQPSQLSQTQT